MLRALTGDSMNLRTTFPLPQPLRASSSGDCNGTVTVQSVAPRTLGRRHSPVATGYVGSAGGPVASVAAGWTRSLPSLAGAQPLAGAGRQARRNYRGWLVANMAQTALPLGPGSVQPHSSDSEATTCSPRPDSPNQPASLGTGTSSLGSETAHSTHGPGCSSPRRTGQRGHIDPGVGAV